MGTPTYTWSSIAPTEVQPNKPVSSTLGSRWAFNLNAAMEGASGAQRLYVGALERLTAGATQRAYVADTFAYTTTATVRFLTIWEFGITQGGTLRFGGEVRRLSGGTTAVLRLQRLRAGVEFSANIATATGASFVSNTVDSPCIPGDLFRFQVGSSDATAVDVEARRLSLSTNGEDLFPCEGLFGYIDANTALT